MTWRTGWIEIALLGLEQTCMCLKCIFNAFGVYFQCIFNVFAVYFQIEIYLYSGALKIRGAGVKRGRQIEFM